MNMLKKQNSKRIKPILKWPGGKEREIPYIFNALPDEIENYYEPFVGGGAVFVNIDANKYYINDKASELANLYRVLKDDSKRSLFLGYIDDIDNAWIKLSSFTNKYRKDLEELYLNYKKNSNKEELSLKIVKFLEMHRNFFTKLFPRPFDVSFENFYGEIKKNLNSKLIRMKVLEERKGDMPKEDIIQNIESALKSSFYMQMRFFLNNINEMNFNNVAQTVVFYFIRNYAYSGMFRYNNNGEFNVPYGGIGYNRNSFKKKIKNFKSEYLLNKLKNTVIGDTDFHIFMKGKKPKAKDFIFLDPPYDTDFSTYNKNEFVKNDQKRLADYLINECKANWMVVIKNTDFIYNLYNKKGLYISSFDKTYQVSFMNRNSKDVKHLLITNYKIGD